MGKALLTECCRKATICGAPDEICNLYPEEQSYSYGKRFAG